MEKLSLDKFGKFLIDNLFDNGINRYNSLSSNKLKSPLTMKLRNELQNFNSTQLATIEKLVVNVLIASSHDFLYALEERNNNEEDITIYIDGENLAEMSDGLNGELFGKDGWLQKFSDHNSFLDDE